MLDFGRELCGDLCLAGEREWLVTNGIGGYASGTVAGILTRRYHGLLIAALQPPVGRTLLLTRLDETATYDGRAYPLFANRWAIPIPALPRGPGPLLNAAKETEIVEPDGFHHLERFHLEGTTPVWTFACADALLERRVWMEQGANTTYIRYDLCRGRGPLALSIKAIADHRDHHTNTHVADRPVPVRVERVAHGLRVTVGEGALPLYLLSQDAGATPQHEWYHNYYLSVEAYRGLDAVDDNLYAGLFQVTLLPGESLTLVASTERRADLDGLAAYARRQAHEQQLLERARPHLVPMPPAIEQLVLAADQFIVQRPLPLSPYEWGANEGGANPGGAGHSVIAGYPWFADWGRDTMISLPGLALATGRHGVAACILRTFAHFVDRGMLPNRFPDEGQAPEYNTVDATLWYFQAIAAAHEATQDDVLLRELFPLLKDIVDWHVRGTRYQIHVDPADGLLYAGEEGVQLTWMDAKVGDWVVTPRVGKPVEINALWYNALRIMAGFARRLGEPAAPYDALAERAGTSFRRFWNGAAGYCYDVIDGPGGDDPALRPNQLMALCLPHSPLSEEQQRAVVEACARSLLTSHGLRSLVPGHPDYTGHYGGDRHQRDAAYHQGTVWGWLIGPFVRAHLRVYRDPRVARSYLEPLFRHLAAHCVGSISEIFDGDPPFTPRGCIAQAWSVAELLHAWRALGEMEESTGTTEGKGDGRAAE